MEKIIETTGDGSPNPPKASQLILNRADQLMARAQGLKASAANLAEVMLGPKPEDRPPAEKCIKPASFLGEILYKLEEIGRVLADAKGHIDQLHSQF